MVQIKYYKTPLGKKNDRYEELSKLMTLDAELMLDLKPRILSIVERVNDSYKYLSAIVVWE